MFKTPALAIILLVQLSSQTLTVDYSTEPLSRGPFDAPGAVIGTGMKLPEELPVALKVEGCSVEGEKIQIDLRVRNGTSSEWVLPLSLDQAKVHAAGKHNRSQLFISFGKAGVLDSFVGGAVLFASTDYPTSYYSIKDHSDAVLRLILTRSELPWTENEQMDLAAQETFIQDAAYMESSGSLKTFASNRFKVSKGVCSVQSTDKQ